MPERCRLGPRWHDFRRPLVMGIINLSPDSFSDGGQVVEPQQAVARARQMVAEGADILDLGGVSTRPGHPLVTAQCEAARLLPSLAAVAGAQLPVALSVDTARADVARRALGLGAHIVNDQGAGADPDMAAVVAGSQAVWVLMHGLSRCGRHDGDQKLPTGRPPSGRPRAVMAFLARRAAAAEAAGVPKGRIWLDVGLGFHKGPAQNWALLRGLPALSRLGMALVVGASRKRFVGSAVGDLPAPARDVASAAAAALAVSRGAHVVRAHNVAATVQAVRVAEAMAAA